MNDANRHLAAILSASARAYAARAVEIQLEAQPDALENYGNVFDLQGDTELRINYLAAAIAADRAELWFDQVAWLKVALTARGIDPKYLDRNLAAIGDELAADLPDALRARPVEFVARAREHLAMAPAEIPSYLEAGGALVDVARRYLLAVLETRPDDARRIVLDAFHAGESVETLCEDVIQRAQREVGRMWQMAEIHVGEEHYGSRIAERVLAALDDVAVRPAAVGKRVLCAGPCGELHELGLRVVSYHFAWAGWDAALLGANMPIPDLLRAIEDFEIDLVALSASTPLQLEPTFATIRAIREHAPRPILVGGAPFAAVPDLWNVVGADGCGLDAQRAVAAGARLVAS